MINSEKDLEDYICNHQEQFIESLKKEFYAKDCDIKFIGRQVRIGDNNIADLVYYYDKQNEDIPVIDRTYIIIELKFRKLEPKDLAQISRYMSCLRYKLANEEKYYKYANSVEGVFVSFGEDDLMQDIIINEAIQNDIHFLSIYEHLEFSKNNWELRDEYIDSLELDNRIDKLYKEE